MPLALGSFGSTFTDGPGTNSAAVTITSSDVPAGASDDQILFIVHAAARAPMAVGRTDSLTELTTLSYTPSGLTVAFVLRVYQVERSAWDGSTTFTVVGSTPVPPRAWIQVTPFVITGGVTGWINSFTDFTPSTALDTTGSTSRQAWVPPTGESFTMAEGLAITLGLLGASASLSPAEGFTVGLNRDVTATVGGGMTDRWLAVASRFQTDVGLTALTSPTWNGAAFEVIPGSGGDAFMGLTFAALGDAPDPPVTPRGRRGLGLIRG